MDQVRFGALCAARHQQKGLTMKEKLFALSLGFGALILGDPSPGANAPAMWAARRVLAQLAERYGETRQSMGLAANNMVMEIFASATSQSWTITVTTPARPDLPCRVGPRV